MKKTKRKEDKAVELEVVDKAVPAPTESPDSHYLMEEKGIISTGIIALNTALFEQAKLEAERIPKVRRIIDLIESDILDEKAIEKLSPIDKLRVLESLSRSLGNSINFLERMQRNSLGIMAILEIYQKLHQEIESISPKTGSTPDPGSKARLQSVKGVLIDMISKRG